jgi:hypothetical protein
MNFCTVKISNFVPCNFLGFTETEERTYLGVVEELWPGG